jgi:hypothetical protein
MSNFLDAPVFDSPDEKITLTVPAAVNMLLAQVTEVANQVNERKFAVAAASRPELAGYKPTKLTPSAVFVGLLQDYARNDKVTAHFLATGKFEMDAIPAPAVKRPERPVKLPA